jgi:hypothetical protein
MEQGVKQGPGQHNVQDQGRFPFGLIAHDVCPPKKWLLL